MARPLKPVSAVHPCLKPLILQETIVRCHRVSRFCLWFAFALLPAQSLLAESSTAKSSTALVEIAAGSALLAKQAGPKRPMMQEADLERGAADLAEKPAIPEQPSSTERQTPGAKAKEAALLSVAEILHPQTAQGWENRFAAIEPSPAPAVEDGAVVPPAESPAEGDQETLVLPEPSVDSSHPSLQSEADMGTYEPELPQGAELAPEGRAEAATQRRLRYRVGLTLRTVYDDNINLSQTNRQDDFYTSIEPTIELGFGQIDGNFLQLVYAPSAFLFLDHTEANAIQHLITLTGQLRLPRLTLNLSQEVQILDGSGWNLPSGTGTEFTRTNLDVSGRTRLNIYTTRLSANYSLTGKTFLTTGLNYTVTDYESFLSSSVISGNVYLNYTYSPKLAFGLGLTGGYNSVEAPSQDQTFEQINARASYELTGKVSASFTAGVEFRQVTEGGVQDNGSPVFEGSLFYQPFDGTSLALNLSRRTISSASLASQDFYSTSVILSGRQRFFQRIYFGLSVGYENSSYFSTLSGFSSTRTDNYYFLQASLDFDLTSFWTAGIFYLYREDDSSLPFFSFYDNQFGLRTSFTF
ncbi:hypothetical protein BH20VER3_BH20VER3_10370 [soil metagenome]